MRADLRTLPDPFLDDLTPNPCSIDPYGIPLLGTLARDKAPGSGSETPSVPPGLSLQNDFPPLSASSKTPSRHNSLSLEGPIAESKRGAKSVLPAVPSLSSRSSTSGRHHGADENINDDTAVPERMIATTAKPAENRPLPHAHDNVSPPNELGELKGGQVDLEGSRQDEDKSAAALPGKRRRPGILDISAARDAAQKQPELLSAPVESSTSATPKKGASVPVAANASGPQTPATANSQISGSPAVKRAGTIRVTTTPKSEVLPAASGVTPVASTAARQSSRHASVASFIPPETPFNDNASDNISSTSASVSRPASPHLGSKVGTAPVRQKTKSQVKKDRQARAKAEENKIVETVKAEEEPVQAPIVGRKKKTKKQRNQDTQPLPQSIPSSPATKSDPVEDEFAKLSDQSIPDNTSKPEAEAKAEVEVVDATDVPEAEENNGREPSQYSMRNVLTQTSVIASMISDGTIGMEDLESFTSPPSINQRCDPSLYGILENNPFPELPEQTIRQIEEGEPVLLRLGGHEHAVVVSDRSVLRYLSKSEAERYLRLRRSVAEDDPEWFATTNYPACMTLNEPWDEFSAYNPSVNTQDLMFSPTTDELSSIFASMLARDYGQLEAEEQWDPTQNLRNEGLAADIETMTLESAQMALKKSEESAVGMARKEADAAEKRLNQLMKKNKKLLREIMDLRT